MTRRGAKTKVLRSAHRVVYRGGVETAAHWCWLYWGIGVSEGGTEAPDDGNPSAWISLASHNAHCKPEPQLSRRDAALTSVWEG